MARAIEADWQRLYGHPVVWLETFIDPQRFAGTCYRAANWVELGLTTGRGKDDQTHRPNRPVKQVLGYALQPNWLVGQAPLAATVYRVQRLRCRVCDAVFTAPVPAAALGPKYDLSCASMIALMRYGYGLPSYRLQALQASLHVPLPDATQWDILRKALPAPRCVHAELIHQAAQAPLLYGDDTPMLVLKPNKQANKQGKKAEAAGASGSPGELNAVSSAVCEVIAAATPKGTRASCIVAQAPGYEVVLYFTGPAHAGQNMEKVLVHRASLRPPPLYMCDALAANTAGDFITVLCHCLSHGWRQVVDVLEQFPEQGRHVLQVLGRVYFHDQHCREQRLDAAQRLEYHQTHSGPLMQELKVWIEQRFEQREVEPNSGLGKALKYLLRHWHELTMFLRHAGAPLDNNLCGNYAGPGQKSSARASAEAAMADGVGIWPQGDG